MSEMAKVDFADLELRVVAATLSRFRIHWWSRQTGYAGTTDMTASDADTARIKFLKLYSDCNVTKVKVLRDGSE